MIESIQTYFQAEKSESLLFISIGILALIAGIAFLIRGTGFLKELAWPLMGVALIQVVVGSAVYFRTDKQVAELQAMYASNPDAYKAQELPRMQKVNRDFDFYKKIEIILMAAGLVLFFHFRNGNRAWMGAGAGLLIQSAIMLTLDLFAEHRADIYTNFISRL